MTKERTKRLAVKTIVAVCLVIYIWYSGLVLPQDDLVFDSDSFVSDEEVESEYYDQGRLAKISADGRKVFLTVEELSAGRRSNIFMFERINEDEQWTNHGSIFTCTELNVHYFVEFDVSADGQTIVASCASRRYLPGKLYIIVWSSGSWAFQELKRDEPRDNNALCDFDFAISVAISSDGRTAVASTWEVGSNDDQCYRRIHTFERSATGEWQQDPDGDIWKRSAVSKRVVALSGDGSTLAMTIYPIKMQKKEREDVERYAVVVYNRDLSGKWNRQMPLLLNSEKVETDYFGTSLALSHDGNVLLIGVRRKYSTSGKGIIYTRSSNGNWRSNSPLIPSDRNEEDKIVSSAILSAKGDVAVLCGDVGLGACWIFVRRGDYWSQQGLKYISRAIKPCSNQCISQSFGKSVHMTPDASMFIVSGFSKGNLEGRGYYGGGGEIFKCTRTGSRSLYSLQGGTNA